MAARSVRTDPPDVSFFDVMTMACKTHSTGNRCTICEQAQVEIRDVKNQPRKRLHFYESHIYDARFLSTQSEALREQVCPASPVQATVIADCGQVFHQLRYEFEPDYMENPTRWPLRQRQYAGRSSSSRHMT